jgi:hypothetical protein
MNSRILLLAVAVVVIGMFAMPSTLSLFSGQHMFYNGSSVNCKKCHADIYDELYASGITPPSPHASGNLLRCEACHITGDIGLLWGNDVIGISWNAGVDVRNNSQAHAAVTVECVFCHDLILNDTSGNPQEIQGSQEAHRSYYNASNQSILLKGGNEACIGCHTHTTINVSWRRPAGYNMTASLASGSWNLSYSLNQTFVNTSSAGQ